MKSKRQENDTKITRKNGLILNSKGMVIAIDPYNSGVAKYNAKSPNYDAVRSFKIVR